MRKDKLSPPAGGSRGAGQQGQVSSLRVGAAGVGPAGGLSVGAAGGCSGSKVWGAGQQDPYQGEGRDQGPSQEVAVSLLHMRQGVWEAGGKLRQSGPRGEAGCVGSESRGGGVGEVEEQGWVQANCSAVARSKRRARQSRRRLLQSCSRRPHLPWLSPNGALGGDCRPNGALGGASCEGGWSFSTLCAIAFTAGAGRYPGR
ncbi:hypothetical protein HaLaN_02349 [Haematococcus lacustris]|uniref:Uncharacterized protein n=1 Tax=Haematococcus lacustris TaxID=44745 RepID=A0A699YKZ2_HAELA|nr:hypothetical protein HaLaN_02349 [Haematococcus lacustris]